MNDTTTQIPRLLKAFVLIVLLSPVLLRSQNITAPKATEQALPARLLATASSEIYEVTPTTLELLFVDEGSQNHGGEFVWNVLVDHSIRVYVEIGPDKVVRLIAGGEFRQDLGNGYSHTWRAIDGAGTPYVRELDIKTAGAKKVWLQAEGTSEGMTLLGQTDGIKRRQGWNEFDAGYSDGLVQQITIHSFVGRPKKAVITFRKFSVVVMR